MLCVCTNASDDEDGEEGGWEERIGTGDSRRIYFCRECTGREGVLEMEGEDNRIDEEKEDDDEAEREGCGWKEDNADEEHDADDKDEDDDENENDEEAEEEEFSFSSYLCPFSFLPSFSPLLKLLLPRLSLLPYPTSFFLSIEFSFSLFSLSLLSS